MTPKSNCLFLSIIMKRFILTFFLTIFSVTSGLHSQHKPLPSDSGQTSEPIVLSDKTGEYSIGTYLEILEDKTGKLTFEEISSDKYKDSFVRSKVKTPSFGFSKSVYWVRFNVKNESKTTTEWYLEHDYPPIDKLTFYSKSIDKAWSERLTGDTFPFSQRDISYRNYIFFLNPSQVNQETYYLRVQSESSLIIPLTLWNTKNFFIKVNTENYIYGIYYGIIIVMVIYNFLLFIFIRDISYLYYIIYTGSIGLFNFSITGTAYEYLWSDSSYFSNKSILFFACGLEIGLIQFTRSFLKVNTFSKILDMSLFIILIIHLSLLISILFFSYMIISQIISGLLIPVFFLSILAGLKSQSDGNRSAKFYLIAFSSILLGGFIFSLRMFGVIPINFFTKNILQIGSTLEVILLSLALGDRFILMRKEKEDAQRDLLDEQKISLDKQTLMANSFARFVPREFIQFLGKKDITQVQLGEAVPKEMSILFSDIRSFTTISEKMTPQENFDFLNAFYKRIGPVIRTHSGFIDKYIGDAIMALFPNRPDDAIRASIEMWRLLNLFNVRRKEKGYDIVRIGIGIHTGSLILGTIGEIERMESTVISDAVNIASRLEGMTKLYGAEILITEQTFLRLNEPERYKFRLIDRVRAKGKSESISVIEILDEEISEAARLKISTRSEFERAVNSYVNKEFAQSKKLFQEILKNNPDDTAAKIYIQRIEDHERYGIPVDWEPVNSLESK